MNIIANLRHYMIVANIQKLNPRAVTDKTCAQDKVDEIFSEFESLSEKKFIDFSVDSHEENGVTLYDSFTVNGKIFKV